MAPGSQLPIPHCYLVTGAAGFIAAKVCEQLLAAGHTVVGVDNLNDYYDVRMKYYRLALLAEQGGGDPAQVAGLRARMTGADSGGRDPAAIFPLKSPRFEFHWIDVEDYDALEQLFVAHPFAAVFNLAARAGVRASVLDPMIYRTTNIIGELNVLKCQARFGVKKHVLASSSSVYAGCPMPFLEDAQLGKMQSPYAETKHQAELEAWGYYRIYGLDVTVLRYFTVFGPAGRPDMAPFRFIKWIDEGTPITLYGDGTQARDFTYVDDIARGTILAAKPLGYEVINLGGGNNPVPLRTMIDWIERALAESRVLAGGAGAAPAAKSRFSPAGPIQAVIAREPASPLDMPATWADISKAKRLLDWAPAISPQDGFRKTVAWHMENRVWLKGIKA